MVKAFAVIGMNYGDEGKGHITNFLSDDKTLNIRFNGGAQAAHTVILADGVEHVFHHFGSGSLKGARTLLASHFIVNPLVFMREFSELRTLRSDWREVLIDPRCRVTTPYDMLINEFDAQYYKKKDTCGLGVYETKMRSVFRQLNITARDIVKKPTRELIAQLKIIENEYIPYRLDQLKIPHDKFREFALPHFSNNLEERFIEYAKYVCENSAIYQDSDVIERFLAKDKDRKLVFEGAQGLLLDQNRQESFPYITPSNTTAENIMECLASVRTKIELETVLVTRSYLSRHGDGPIYNAVGRLPYYSVNDPSNPPNGFQGTMRFGFLDKNWYDSALTEMRKQTGQPVSVALTCVDQIDYWCKEKPLLSGLIYYENGKRREDTIEDALGNISLFSVGRKESDIVEVNK